MSRTENLLQKWGRQAASNERIREVVERYAEGATVEDPVGSDVLTTREQIAAFYGTLEGLEQETRLVELRVSGGEAAFHCEILTRAGDATYTLAPFDAMAFDDDGRITSMRAYWSDADMVVA